MVSFELSSLLNQYLITKDVFFTVAPLSSYVKGRLEDKRCRHAACLCEMEMVRCMGHYKNEIDTTKILHQQCNITGNSLKMLGNDIEGNLVAV